MISKRISAIVITGSLLLTLGITAFASDNQVNPFPQVASIQQREHGMRVNKPRQQKDCYTHIQQLLEQGLISQEQADKWIAFDKEQYEIIKAEMEKVKNMTEEERKVYFEKEQQDRPDPLSEVVKAGIITQAQADKIKEQAFPMKNTKGFQGNKEHMINISDHTSQLVEKKVISQEQADQWIDFHNKKEEERKAELEKIKNMTEEERKAYFEQKERPEPLSELVEAGILTQEQADTIKGDMPMRHERINKGR